MTRMRLAIFDVDGTLVDSQAHIRAALTGAFAAEGLTAPDDMLRIVGLSLPEAVRALLPDAAQAEVDRVVAGYRAGYHDLRTRISTPLFPGARDAVETLARDDALLLGIATGKSRRGLDHLLEENGLARYFVTQQVADDHPSKPHPSMVLTALAETGVAPGDAVIIGDTSFDIEMGRTAGIGTVGVTWGNHGRAALAGADRLIDSFAGLPDSLRAIWGAVT